MLTGFGIPGSYRETNGSFDQTLIDCLTCDDLAAH